MLIDNFSPQSINALYGSALDPHVSSYLLIDGAFKSGAHRVFDEKEKRILFDILPGCNDTTRDVSPFVVAFEPGDRRLRVLFERFSGRPMVSVIETSESLTKLSTRLAAWCVIEVDNQRFNLRFSDTRRLPAILNILTPQQRAKFTGPMKRWRYIARNGEWEELPVNGGSQESAVNPILNGCQFAVLVDDSRADEFLVLLCDRGREVYNFPSRSHSLVTTALRAAAIAKLEEDKVLQWCMWFWERDKCDDDTVAATLLQTWQRDTQ
ncbi:DUF4123 domain-containing protein [Massilia sp. UMI-21]|nr:DUF4123 domain-containing protein [Massilia sp. UMI-21]